MDLFELNHKNKKYSIPRTDNFEDLVKVIRKKFNFPEDLPLKFEFCFEITKNEEPFKTEIKDSDEFFEKYLNSDLNQCQSIKISIISGQIIHIINHPNEEKNNNKDLIDETNEQKEKHKRLELMYIEMNKKISKILNSVDGLSKFKNGIEQKIKDMEQKYEELFFKCNEIEKYINKNSKINTLINEVNGLNNKVIFLNNENEQKKQKIFELKNQIDKLKQLINNNNNINNNCNNNKIDKNLETNNRIKKISLINSIQLENNKNDKLSCKFLNNEKNLKRIKKGEIKKNSTIPFNIEVINNGGDNITWPNDTFIKCINDDSDIYFNYSNIKEEKIVNNQIVHNFFKVNVKFKNYNNIKRGKHFIRFKLVSDSQGDIGNDIGFLTLIIE